ncbi:MAG TPA: HEPN domain-containing protein [Spirochaetota bacterium]|nr:HEPN domain-containing protein [Spirochaetota bacterium]
MKEKVREWIELAFLDLTAAERLLDDENLTTIISFHAHQCVEKSFKAIIEMQDAHVPKIHDLSRLFSEISGKNSLKVDLDILDELSRLYIDSRYPALTGLMPYGRPSIVDAEKYVIFARELHARIIALVKKHSY